MAPPLSPRSPAATSVALPSSDPSITLEGRLSLKPGTGAYAAAILIIAHPHALLGGSLRDPVASALASRGASSPAFAAVCRVNARGVGSSGGGRAVGLGPSPDDVLAVAGAVVERVLEERAEAAKTDVPPPPPPRVYLAGHSWGACVCAAAAATAASAAPPLPFTIGGVATVSPPLGLVPSLALGAGRAFAALARAPATPVLAIIGDRDQFAAPGRVTAAVEAVSAARAKIARPPGAPPPAPAACVIVEGADHFWAPDDDSWTGNWGEVAGRVVDWCERVEEETRAG